MMRAVIFDLDDTLVQTNAASTATWRRLAQEFAPHVGLAEDELHADLNRTRRWFWADADRHRTWRFLMAESAAEALRMALHERGEAIEDDAPLLQGFADRYESIFFESLVLFPDARQVLDELRTRGLKLAMITNGGAEWQRRKIEMHALAPLFE
jgi:putative hydrolase of the HAD superfamily